MHASKSGRYRGDVLGVYRVQDTRRLSGLSKQVLNGVTEWSYKTPHWLLSTYLRQNPFIVWLLDPCASKYKG